MMQKLVISYKACSISPRIGAPTKTSQSEVGLLAWQIERNSSAKSFEIKLQRRNDNRVVKQQTNQPWVLLSPAFGSAW